MQHEAARSKAGGSYDDEPTYQPMRPVLRGQIARNPSTDQKRVRRANTMRKSAEWTPGHVNCGSCGYQGHPTLGEGTAPSCGACGSYSIKKTRPTDTPQPAPAYPENSRYLHQGDYGKTSAWAPPADHDEWGPSIDYDNTCPGCMGPANKSNPEGTCNSCMGEVRAWQNSRPDDDRARETNDWRGHEASKTATVVNTQAERLNPGDQIRTPNGRTMKVNRVRPHETSMKHVYVDTDGGTTVSERSAAFEVVPRNSQQQSQPGYGTPGGNSNSLPFDSQSGGSNTAPSASCPQCGGNGTLVRQGDHFTCSRCGYSESFGGAGGKAFSDSPRVVRVSAYSSVNNPMMSVVARRATDLLNQEDHQ